MKNVELGELQATIKIGGRYTDDTTLMAESNNLRYTDDTTLMAESKEELKNLLKKVKEESETPVLKLNIQQMENRRKKCKQ